MSLSREITEGVHEDPELVSSSTLGAGRFGRGGAEKHGVKNDLAPQVILSSSYGALLLLVGPFMIRSLWTFARIP